MTITAPPKSPATLDTVIESAEKVADEVVSLALRKVDGTDFSAWEPGAHIDVHLGDDLIRQYSVCSTPEDLSVLKIGVLRTSDSRGGSAYVHEHLTPGTALTISAPRNNFPLLKSRKYMFIAGGVGITPMLPMLEQAEAEGKAWVLHYGGRSRTSMAFADELLTKYGPEKIFLYPNDEGNGLDLNTALALPRAHMLVYACGPGGMLTAIEELCMGWPPGVLHTERFVAAELGAASSSEPFEVELAQTGGSVTVQSDQTIVEAVEEAGARVLSSCRAGLCGTCETRILAGEPEHRDAVLTQEDKDAGEVMLVCVSRAAAGCSRLVLDL